MKLALAQINPIVGDFAGNQNKIISFARDAAAKDADMVLFPELSVCGYPPADFLEKRAFLEQCRTSVEQIAQQAPEIGVVVGYPAFAKENAGKRACNVAALLHRGRVVFEQAKKLLPYYDVFDEQRYFEPASSQSLVEFGGRRIAITICEDAWNDKEFWPRPLYAEDPVEDLIEAGADLVLNLSASPFWAGKPCLRRKMLGAIARRTGVPVAMVNQVGGDDGLVFDGSSFLTDVNGGMAAACSSFREELCVVTVPEAEVRVSQGVSRPAREEFPLGGVLMDDMLPDVYRALVLGTRDYVEKCGFSNAIVGLSGGLDSALVATIAADALGAENVTGVLMPSQYSSAGSVDDAEAIVRNLGIRCERIAIEPVYRAFEAQLADAFAGRKADLTEENLQSRIRGTLLMALSNKFNALVLTTGNKSEMSVGYATLYGDMAGALAVIGDIFKTDCYRLAHYVNRERERIPQATLDKAPSAELRPGQMDTDSLPPYEVLDPILRLYVEEYRSAAYIEAKTGAPAGIIAEVLKLVERSEYKRQQAAPILKVSRKSFGPGRRFPIAARAQV